MELDERLAMYEEDTLLLENQVAELKSHVLFTTGPQSLTNDFRDMVNNPEFSDVVFICEDGERVQASRMLLMARCPLLKSMLSNGMAESKQSEVILGQVSSDAFLLVLKFLYTGEVQEEDLKFSVLADQETEAHGDRLNEHAVQFPPFSLDWYFMFKAMEAARFFLLDEVECVMVKRLWADLPRDRYIVHTEDTLDEVTKRLTTVCSFTTELNEGPIRKNMDILGLHLVRIMCDHDLSMIHLRNLSDEAMRFYLFNTQNFCVDGIWSLSFREYVKLWQLMMWCISSTAGIDYPYQEASTRALWLVEPKRVAAMLFHTEEQKQLSDEISSHMSELQGKFPATIHREKFERLSDMINLVCIHPELLIDAVEPLSLFPSRRLDVVLRDQLIRASRWRKQIQAHDRQCRWLVVVADRAQLAGDYSLPSQALAVGNVAMWWCHCAYEWEIVHIFSKCPRFEYMTRYETISKLRWTLEVGFLSLETGERIGYSRLSESRKALALRLEEHRLTFFVNGKETSQEQFSGISFQSTAISKDGMRIRLKLDRMKKIFSFSFEPYGQEHYVVCPNLPTGVLYPAVYVDYNEKFYTGETRILLREGFEFVEDVQFNRVTVERKK